MVTSMLGPERSDRAATVLVIDQDGDFHERVGGRLRSVGYRVLDAANAETGLYLFGHHAVDLVLAAHRLPGITGMELCHLLRERRGPPVVLITDGAQAERRVAFLDEGAEDCIDRPADLAPLVARIGAILRRTAPTARPGAPR